MRSRDAYPVDVDQTPRKTVAVMVRMCFVCFCSGQRVNASTKRSFISFLRYSPFWELIIDVTTTVGLDTNILDRDSFTVTVIMMR